MPHPNMSLQSLVIHYQFYFLRGILGMVRKRLFGSLTTSLRTFWVISFSINAVTSFASIGEVYLVWCWGRASGLLYLNSIFTGIWLYVFCVFSCSWCHGPVVCDCVYSWLYLLISDRNARIHISQIGNYTLLHIYQLERKLKSPFWCTWEKRVSIIFWLHRLRCTHLTYLHQLLIDSKSLKKYCVTIFWYLKQLTCIFSV